MAAYRHHAGTGAADIAAQQGQVHHLLDRCHCVGMMGEAHAPGDHRCRCRSIAAGDVAQLRLIEARARGQVIPFASVEVGEQRVQAFGMRGDEGVIEHRAWCRAFAFQQRFHHAFERGQIAADLYLIDFIGDRDALIAQQLAHVFRVGKMTEATLAQRVDRQHRGAALFGVIQRRHHPWVIAGRVLADDDEQVGLLEVFQRAGALADADAVLECVTRWLVAEVGGVGQVGAAVSARGQLPQKRGFVAAAAGGIERNGFRRQRRELAHGHGVGFIPVNCTEAAAGLFV